MRILKLSLAVVLTLFVAACSQDQPVEIPTLFPTAEDATAESVATDVIPSPTILPTEAPPSVTPGRQEFPPTWTPEPLPTETPLPPTFTPIPIGPSPQGPLPACANFAPDYSRNATSFAAGAEPTIYWTTVEGALNYEVLLYEEDTRLRIVDEYTDQFSYTFGASLFEAGKRYGWEVIPYDDRLIQMCLAIGDVFNVTR